MSSIETVRPRRLLLDEPSMGLAPLLVDQIMDALVALRRGAGMTVLLVERNAVAALSIADRGYVIETGLIGHAGAGVELLQGPTDARAGVGHGRRGAIRPAWPGRAVQTGDRHAAMPCRWTGPRHESDPGVLPPER